jgi:hypothetical protein
VSNRITEFFCETVLIVLPSIFNGTTPLRHDFGHIYTQDLWQQNVETPLGQFAAKVFSESNVMWCDI